MVQRGTVIGGLDQYLPVQLLGHTRVAGLMLGGGGAEYVLYRHDFGVPSRSSYMPDKGPPYPKASNTGANACSIRRILSGGTSSR